jgi:chorismate mutase
MRGIKQQVFGFLAALLLLVAPAAWGDASPDPVTPLLELMNTRLAVAADVAKAKWNSGAPIEDPLREAQILDRVAADAPAHGLPPAAAREFFRAQIEAGKIVQNELHRRWKAAGQPPFTSPPDLARDIRPRLDQLAPALLAAFSAARPALAEQIQRTRLTAQITRLLNVDGVTDNARHIATAPLNN